jgi:hypothetical protein
LLLTAILLLADAIVSGVAVYVGVSRTPMRVAGDLMLLEVGLLAILGGVVEFSRSKGVYEIRRVAFHTKEEFSMAKHKEASMTAVGFFCAGLVLFSLLVVLAVLESGR